ncbi:Nodulin-like [Musa troglodytarum]|uniref:Nodulin-like n=1 Tax=Musa troglodytarum TaxID=320322 RepID=A0A9E7KC36_9LILI|nr:Nodulin-like [Musa troglodytarum]
MPLKSSFHVAIILFPACQGRLLVAFRLRHHIGDLLAEYLRNFGTVASPLGSYSLNVRVAGHLYDTEALKQNNGLKKCSASVTADICAKFRADKTATENEMAMGSFSGRGKEEEETGTASLQDEVNYMSA